MINAVSNLCGHAPPMGGFHRIKVILHFFFRNRASKTLQRLMKNHHPATDKGMRSSQRDGMVM